MQAGQYSFHCTFTASAKLPSFKGSMLRGGFGHALKNVVCALRRKQCAACLLLETCVYAYIFETAKIAANNDNGRARISGRPHPYVLRPPLTTQRSFNRDDAFDFGLTLFGRANDYLPHIVYAFERLGGTGLHNRAASGQGRFSLNQVQADGITVYDGNKKILEQNRAPARLELQDAPDEPVHSLTIRLLTPLRLKQNNKLRDALPFQLLIRAALRRISSLAEAYGTGEPPLDYPGLAQRADRVQVQQSDCQWVDLERYSSRQKTGMLLGGLQGSITYEGDLAEFIPLLKYCEQTHMGKQTAFGLGRIEVQD